MKLFVKVFLEMLEKKQEIENSKIKTISKLK